jgi:hypothetical protein
MKQTTDQKRKRQRNLRKLRVRPQSWMSSVWARAGGIAAVVVRLAEAEGSAEAMRVEVAATAPDGPRLLRVGEVRMHDTFVAAWEAEPNQEALTLVLRGVLGRLRLRGWSVERDPDTVKNYPSIARWHYVGSRGDLRLVAED